MTTRLPRGTADAVGARLFPPVDPYAADPVAWARDVLGVHLWSRQRQIIESVRDTARTAVRSGHGVGKTLSAAVTCLWFMDTHTSSRVISTAPTWGGVEKLLWTEIGQLHARARSRPAAQSRPIFQTTPLQTELRLADGRYAIGLTAKPENSEAFAGHHAPHILVIFDEASGVHQRIFEVAEGYLTTDGARALLIGNPTRNSGELYDAFHSKRAEYSTIAISALDAPAFTGEDVPEAVRASLTGKAWVESRRRAWGEGSPLYQVRVLGQFAKSAEDTVMSLGAVEDAQLRELPADSAVDRVVIGCDVARFGTDETVIAERVGQRVRIVEHYFGKPTTHTAARVAHWAGRHPRVSTRIVIDDTGVGGGVTDQLRAERWNVTAFNASASAFRPDKYPNRRSELWFEMAEQLPGLDLDPDDQLAADLTAPMYTYDTKMRQVVEAKKDTKKRLGRSPDRADAVMLTLAGSHAFTGLVFFGDPSRWPALRQGATPEEIMARIDAAAAFNSSPGERMRRDLGEGRPLSDDELRDSPM